MKEPNYNLRYKSEKLKISVNEHFDLTEDTDIALELIQVALGIFKHFPHHLKEYKDKIRFVEGFPQTFNTLLEEWKIKTLESIKEK